MGGTRADHDKNYNTHVWSHWLKADFMGNEALVTVFFYQDSDSHHRKRPHFTFGGCSIASMTSSLSFGLNTWSRKNVQLWTNETRTFLSCTISRLRLLYMLVGRCRTTTTEPRRLFGTEAVSCPSSALPFACFEAISEAAAPGSFRRAHVNQSWNAQWSPLIRIMEEEQYKVTPK